MIFSIVKELFKSFEGLTSGVILLVGAERVLIDDVTGLRKRLLTCCQISSSKIFLVRIHKK